MVVAKVKSGENHRRDAASARACREVCFNVAALGGHADFKALTAIRPSGFLPSGIAHAKSADFARAFISLNDGARVRYMIKAPMGHWPVVEIADGSFNADSGRGIFGESPAGFGADPARGIRRAGVGSKTTSLTFDSNGAAGVPQARGGTPTTSDVLLM